MHLVELLEVAALLAVNGRSCLDGAGYASEQSVGAYWLAARRRLDCWRRALPDAAEGRACPRPWAATRPVVEEIFTSEVLARVGTALAEGWEHRQQTGYIAPVFRSVLMGHHEARNRALKVLAAERESDGPEVAGLNRLCRRCERWTDMLLARLEADCPVRELAYDPDQVREFAADLREDAEEFASREADALLVQAGIRAAFAPSLSATAPHAEWNRRVASSLVACFRAEALDATGPLRDQGMDRLGCALGDLEAWTGELLGAEACRVRPRA